MQQRDISIYFIVTAIKIFRLSFFSHFVPVFFWDKFCAQTLTDFWGAKKWIVVIWIRKVELLENLLFTIISLECLWCFVTSAVVSMLYFGSSNGLLFWKRLTWIRLSFYANSENEKCADIFVRVCLLICSMFHASLGRCFLICPENVDILTIRKTTK